MKEGIAKYWEYNKECYGLVIDFCKAYDSLARDQIWCKMEEFGVPRKLIRLASLNAVKVGNEYSLSVDVKTGVRQSDSVSPLLFNLALEAVLNKIRDTHLSRNWCFSLCR